MGYVTSYELKWPVLSGQGGKHREPPTADGEPTEGASGGTGGGGVSGVRKSGEAQVGVELVGSGSQVRPSRWMGGAQATVTLCHRWAF